MKTHKISWLNIPGYIPETWNPIIGCSKVSPGCENCYALSMAKRLAGMERKSGKMDYRLTLMPDQNNKQTEWNGHTLLRMDHLQKPEQWAKPRAIFVCSMGDLFHEHCDFEKIDAVFSVMSDCDQHLYLLLTKRPEGAKRFFQWKSLQHGIPWQPKPNIWLGVTAENQEQANKRIPILLDIPAAKRFVSIEPMLGRVDFQNLNEGIGLHYDCLSGKAYSLGEEYTGGPQLDWVICGGETGSKARPMHPDRVRSVRDQCKAAAVPFFFKQWGEWLPMDHTDDEQFWKSKRSMEVGYSSTSNTVFKVGTKTAGDLLYGKQYHEWPIQSVNPSIPQSVNPSIPQS